MPSRTVAEVAPPEAPTTPAARRLARELGVDLARVVGSGPGGRITREDVQEWPLAWRPASRSSPASRSMFARTAPAPTSSCFPDSGPTSSAFAAVVPASLRRVACTA